MRTARSWTDAGVLPSVARPRSPSGGGPRRLAPVLLGPAAADQRSPLRRLFNGYADDPRISRIPLLGQRVGRGHRDSVIMTRTLQQATIHTFDRGWVPAAGPRDSGQQYGHDLTANLGILVAPRDPAKSATCDRCDV